MSKRKLKAEDLYQIKSIIDLDIAPAGDKVILEIQEIDQETEKKSSNLWIQDLKSKELQPFTRGKNSHSNPVWSPDGNFILFLSNRDDETQPQLYIIPTNGGESRKLTNDDAEYSHFFWSPDARTIYTCLRKKDRDAIERKKDEKKQKLGIVYREVEKTFYRLDGYGWLPEDEWHLWRIDALSGEGEQISDLTIVEGSPPFISSDGKLIGFFSNQAEDPDLDLDAIDLFVLDTTSLLVSKVNTPAGSKSFGTFSPDGETIAYVGRKDKWADWQNNRVWIVPTQGNEAAIDLTEENDFHVASSTLNDNGPAPFSAPIWSLDGKWIFFQVSRHGNTGFNKVNTHSKQVIELISEKGVVGKPKFDRSQSNFVFIFGSLNGLPELHHVQTDKGSFQHESVSAINDVWFQKIKLGETQEHWFKGSDGNDLQGWIIFPPDFDPQMEYPSILEIHGGPLMQYGNFWMHEFHYLAAQGYVVHFCNPRGGQGYGESHSHSIFDGKWGTVDYQDLMAWTDYVEKLAFIDSKRMGVTGGSYGGYMTVWIIGHTHRFKAAVAQRCVSNIVSMWGSSDFNWSFQTIFGNKSPYEEIETLWECSPMKHIGAARTPTLLIHSEQDLRCPLEQSQQVYTALRKLNVPTKLVIFPEESHGLSRIGRTDRRIVRLQQISRGFESYLK